MLTIEFAPRPAQRLSALGLILLAHGALFYAWQAARQLPALPTDQVREALTWVWVRATPPAAPAVPVAAPVPPSTRPAAATRPAQRSAPVTPIPAAPRGEPVAPTLSAAPAPSLAPSLRDRLQDARRELGKIDADIRKERRARGLIDAPADSPQLRMQSGMARAADLAPRAWYEAPKVSEIQDPGGYGRKRYRVVGSAVTYCVTVESNHAPDGLDTMRNGIKPKITNCPAHEEPATTQAW